MNNEIDYLTLGLLVLVAILASIFIPIIMHGIFQVDKEQKEEENLKSKENDHNSI